MLDGKSYDRICKGEFDVMPNVLSVFSGGGGIDLGFKKAGFDICFSTDFWKPACDTLEKNKVGKLVVCDDIRNIDYDSELKKIGMKKGDIDILVGGPPCPAYSKSRFYRTEKKRALEDENSFTLYEYFRALDEIRPKVFFFENVFGFVYKPHQAAFDLLKSKAEEFGYELTYQVVNTADYGVPQIRERFICVGVLRGFASPFVFPEKRIAIFVDGCFWHGHECRNITPSDNAEYWKKKRERNKRHDLEITKLFEKRGWMVIRIWECELKKKNEADLEEKLKCIAGSVQHTDI